MAETNNSNTSSIPEEQVNQPSFSETPDGYREGIRSQIAKWYIIGFFAFLLLGVGYCAWLHLGISEVKEVILAISAVLSGPLGFIIGFYFKSADRS